MNKHYSLGNTIAAIVTCVIVYLIMIYLIVPIFEKLLLIFGRYFIPERFGGGSDADNPGLLTLIIRGAISNWISAMVAFYLSFYFWGNIHTRSVAIVFGLFVLIFTSLFVMALGRDTISSLIILITMAPAAYISYDVWRNKGFTWW